MLRLFMPDFEDTNKKELMNLFRRKEIFDQAVIVIMEGESLYFRILYT